MTKKLIDHLPLAANELAILIKYDTVHGTFTIAGETPGEVPLAAFLSLLDACKNALRRITDDDGICRIGAHLPDEEGDPDAPPWLK